jgi:predicted carbohydrate-binding protein with CBM5 and CBM33 domain
MKRKLLAALAGALLVPGLMLAVPGLASAHGYISGPPSRQAECAQRLLDCGDIKYEPQSVEGPKGLQSCSGGNSRFAELDDDSKPWRATPTGNSVTFTWTFTAPHRTSTFNYYVGGTLLKSVNLAGAQPPQGMQHTVDLGGRTGRVKVLAVWNVYDTANAFYSCVDLQVG